METATAVPPVPPPSSSHQESAAAWRAPVTRITLALTMFLVTSGIFVWAASFSASGQYVLLAHTLLGIGFLVPFSVYQVRHLVRVWNHPLWYVAVTGYAGAVLLSVTCVSGVAVTLECAFGRKTSATWDFLHESFGLAASLLFALHVVEAALFRTYGRRHRREGGVDQGLVTNREAVRTGWIVLGSSAAIWTACLLPSLAYSGMQLEGEFPDDYGYKYGPNPFSPSLATTRTGGALAPHALSGSEGCGDPGCHEQIVHEWEPSAHRYASRSKFFQAIQKTMADHNGAESTRYCAGCHDPIALFSGAKNIYDEDLSSPGADEGVSCVACHSIVQTDVKGNAAYVMDPPRRYLFEESGSPFARGVAGFLIRAWPRHHVSTLSRDLLKTPEFCGACHKQFIDEEINRVGWVQLQNQYDNWRKSHWFRGSTDDASRADPTKTLSCRECHMRLSDSLDPSAGDLGDLNRRPDDGKHRNHRFIGANQWLPKLHGLPGADEQVRLTEEWLRGETVMPEIANKWATGPAVPIEIIAPAKVAAGSRVNMRVVATSNKVGHDFPTGPLDIIQSWVELIVLDSDGRTVFESGVVDAKGFIQEGSFLFKAEGIDAAGNLIDRHNLWDMVGARFRRSLFPGFSDTAEYQFVCPSAASKAGPLPTDRNFDFRAPDSGFELRIKARLRYRKVDQTLIDFIAPGSGLTAPITDMSSTEARVSITAEEEARR